MCDHCAHHDGADLGDPALKVDDGAVSRRQFGGVVAGIVAAAGVVRWLGDTPVGAAKRLPPAVQSDDGLVPIANAMHIHSSFSEQQASLEAQVSEAYGNRNAVVNPGQIVMWETEHDWRETAHGAPTHIAFTSLTKENVAGRPVVWQPQEVGTMTVTTMELVFDQVSPYDSTPNHGALHLVAQSSGSALGELLAYPNFASGRLAHRTNVAGQSLGVDLYPVTADGADTYLELRVELSYRPSVSGRPAGQYQLSYRFGSASSPGYVQQQLLGIVNVPVTPGVWQQCTLDVAGDIAQIWPDVIAEDNSVQDVWLGAASTNAVAAEGYFGNLQFVRTLASSDDVITTQASIKSTLAASYPGVLLPRGREISYFDRHVCAFGDGAAFLPDYSPNPNVWANDPGWVETTGYVGQVHAMGGLASFNHPFGTAAKAPSPASTLQSGLMTVFAETYAYDLCGADILEVGFQERGGHTVDGGTNVVADLSTHLALWDMHSRNSRWVTGTGVSDNHTGGVRQWVKDKNRFLTYPWVSSIDEPTILAALYAGRAFVGELGTFSGALDLLVDTYVRMGEVSIRPDLTSRTVSVIAYNLPVGSIVRVVQGPIDNPGSSTPGSGSSVVATVPATAFATGSADVTVDTSVSSFVRCEVVTSAARTVAFTNPVYLLAGPAARSVPPERQAADP